MVVKMIIALILTILVYMLQLNFKLFFTIPFARNGMNVIDLIMIAYFSYILSKAIEKIIKGEKFVVDFHILLSFVIIILANSLNVMFAVVAVYILFYYLAGYLESKKILYFIIGLAIAIVIMMFQSYIIGLYNNFIPEYLIQYIALFLIVVSLLYNKLNSINEEFLLLVLILMFGPTNILSLIVILIYYMFIAYNFIKKAV